MPDESDSRSDWAPASPETSGPRDGKDSEVGSAPVGVGDDAAGSRAVDGEAELERLRGERDVFYERLLRKTAEFDNYRKRTERERRELAQYAAGDLIESLLPIIDDFERALEADAAADPAAYRRGVELIARQLQELLARRGVTPVEALGRDFDPRFHQAVTHEASPGRREGEVIEEVRRGYMLRDRLLRPAMVKVAKA